MASFEIDPASRTEFNRNPLVDSDEELTATHYSVAIFKPPFTVGEGFSKVALGRDGHNMSVLHIGSTTEATVLEISRKQNVDRGPSPDPELPTEGLESPFEVSKAMEKVGQRVIQFIEDPALAYKLMDQNPFPKPE